MGNLRELRSFLKKVPVRLDIDRMVLRKVTVEMTDIFASKKSAADAAKEQAKESVASRRPPPSPPCPSRRAPAAPRLRISLASLHSRRAA